MFTGIIQEIGRVREVRQAGPGRRLVVGASRVLDGVQVGDSIAVNGVCLTAAERGPDWFLAETMPETLRRTNLGLLQPGDPVNLEASLRAGGAVGGHFVQGHVDGTARVLDMTPDGAALVVRFATPPELLRYIVPKGYVAVDGVSLTVVQVEPSAGDHAGWFSVALVSHTQEHITLPRQAPGYVANIEVDILGKYVERFVHGFGDGFDDGSGDGFRDGRRGN